MDTVTQGLLGAAVAYAVCPRKLGRKSWWIGAVAGVLPDADTLIRSADDPLLGIEFHRHFTHALAFVPFGAALASLPWMASAALRRHWPRIYGMAFLAYLSHPLLDLCTSYGTQLLWPFSTERIAWHNVSVIDPIYTLVLALGGLWALWKLRAGPAWIALLLSTAYLGWGAVLHSEALQAQARIAHSRGHQPQRAEVFPTFANLIVWHSVYRAGDRLYADAIRTPWWGSASWAVGESAAWVSPNAPPTEVEADPRADHDFQRFAWFTAEWMFRPEGRHHVIADARYSLRARRLQALWGIRLHPHRQPSVEWLRLARREPGVVQELWQEILGTHPDYLPLPKPWPAEGD